MRLENHVDDRGGDQALRVRRDIFSDPLIHQRELERLFEGGWIYLAHESQLRRSDDYVTVMAGRRPVVVMRGSDGKLRAFYNACPHKGATICPLDRGNARLHVCPYHSWSFGSDGRNRAIKSKAEGGYTAEFLSQSHDLVPIARFGQYRGFLFGSLSPHVPPLEEYLGDARVFIDLAEDQGTEGLELVPGQSTFTYEGNWKHQLENCSDAYHVTSVHPTYLKVAQARANEAADSALGGVWNRTASALGHEETSAQAGSFTFANGHVATWVSGPPSAGHPLFERTDELVERLGPVRAKWMFYGRNVTIFPNLQFVDNFSSQIRVLRPLSADRTEMMTWCVGPRGEGAAARTSRLRQYEDFFMPSGMATSDDLVVYQDCQVADTAANDTWQSYERGVASAQDGDTPEARELGIRPLTAVRGAASLCDETLMHNYYREWARRMADAHDGVTPCPMERQALPPQ